MPQAAATLKSPFPDHLQTFRQLYLPDVWFSPSMFLTGDFLSPLAATVAFMLVWCMMMLMHNLYRVYSYNARARALNGLMASMTVATMVSFFSFPWLFIWLPTIAMI